MRSRDCGHSHAKSSCNSSPAASKSSAPQYAALQKKREQDSRTALQSVSDVPEVKAVLDKPSADTARKLADALKGKDLSAKVGRYVSGFQATDLDAYVTERALSGLFTTLADEEKKIRENPAARTSELLKKVFGQY